MQFVQGPNHDLADREEHEFRQLIARQTGLPAGQIAFTVIAFVPPADGTAMIRIVANAPGPAEIEAMIGIALQGLREARVGAS